MLRLFILANFLMKKKSIFLSLKFLSSPFYCLYFFYMLSRVFSSILEGAKYFPTLSLFHRCETNTNLRPRAGRSGDCNHSGLDNLLQNRRCALAASPSNRGHVRL